MGKKRKTKEKNFKLDQNSFPSSELEQETVIASNIRPGNLRTMHWHFHSELNSSYPDVVEVSFAAFYDDWCLFEKSAAGLKLQSLLRETRKKDIQMSQKVTTE